MHIPPYHRKPSWQRFLVGTFIGAILSYFIFVYMHGNIVEGLLAENKELDSQITELKKKNETLTKDNENKQSNEPVTVEEIEIEILNREELRLNRLTVLDLVGLIKEEIDHIIGEDISTLAENDRLLKSTIQNKDFQLDDFTYNFSVETLTISRTVKIEVEAEISN
ncbi:sporulation membrane protein YtrI [Virgibacillus kekensis]|uniref:Sporulation membrane protein YtrI n=1 Tax=Virgibacillus kekensis TaxID=202261 RepID=A0ABV9DD54_9BACI